MKQWEQILVSGSKSVDFTTRNTGWKRLFELISTLHDHWWLLGASDFDFMIVSGQFCCGFELRLEKFPISSPVWNCATADYSLTWISTLKPFSPTQTNATYHGHGGLISLHLIDLRAFAWLDRYESLFWGKNTWINREIRELPESVWNSAWISQNQCETLSESVETVWNNVLKQWQTYRFPEAIVFELGANIPIFRGKSLWASGKRTDFPSLS